MAKAATLRSAPAIEVAMLRSGRVLQRSKNRFDSPMARTKEGSHEHSGAHGKGKAGPQLRQRRRSDGHQPIHAALLAFLRKEGASGTTVLPAIEGFGASDEFLWPRRARSSCWRWGNHEAGPSPVLERILRFQRHWRLDGFGIRSQLRLGLSR